MNNSFNFKIKGCGNTEDEAWEDFKNKARNTFQWIKGHLFWKYIPKVCHYFELNETFVVGEVEVLKEIPEGWTEATIEPPYIGKPPRKAVYDSKSLLGFPLESL